MFDCTLTEVEVWADDASNFRTRWQFYNRMKERKVDAAARQPLVLSKKYLLPMLTAEQQVRWMKFCIVIKLKDCQERIVMKLFQIQRILKI